MANNPPAKKSCPCCLGTGMENAIALKFPVPRGGGKRINRKRRIIDHLKKRQELIEGIDKYLASDVNLRHDIEDDEPVAIDRLVSGCVAVGTLLQNATEYIEADEAQKAASMVFAIAAEALWSCESYGGPKLDEIIKLLRMKRYASRSPKQVDEVIDPEIPEPDLDAESDSDNEEGEERD